MWTPLLFRFLYCELSYFLFQHSKVIFKWRLISHYAFTSARAKCFEQKAILNIFLLSNRLTGYLSLLNNLLWINGRISFWKYIKHTVLYSRSFNSLRSSLDFLSTVKISIVVIFQWSQCKVSYYDNHKNGNVCHLKTAFFFLFKSEKTTNYSVLIVGLWPLSPLRLQVYVSYDYGTTFMLISDKFQLSGAKAKDDRKQVISQFYHSPADNRRVSLSRYGFKTKVCSVTRGS